MTPRIAVVRSGCCWLLWLMTSWTVSQKTALWSLWWRLNYLMQGFCVMVVCDQMSQQQQPAHWFDCQQLDTRGSLPHFSPCNPTTRIVHERILLYTLNDSLPLKSFCTPMQHLWLMLTCCWAERPTRCKFCCCCAPAMEMSVRRQRKTPQTKTLADS